MTDLALTRTPPPFAYYGGKARLADRIAGLLHPHRCYTEAYAGACAVLLAKAPATHEVLNDLDGDLINFWRVLRDQPDELCRAMALTPYARDEFAVAADRPEDLSDLERARRWWVRITQAHGRIPTAGWSTGFSRSGSRADETLRAAGRAPQIAWRLRHVSIEHRDALEVLEAYDGPDTAHYIDPPYPASSPRNTDRKSMYTVDMREDGDHEQLAEVAHRLAGHVLISGYRCELYDRLYDGWATVDMPALRSNGGRSSSRHRAVETVWSNRPLQVQGSLLTDCVPVGQGASDA